MPIQELLVFLIHHQHHLLHLVCHQNRLWNQLLNLVNCHHYRLMDLHRRLHEHYQNHPQEEHHRRHHQRSLLMLVEMLLDHKTFQHIHHPFLPD
jgi:hypothetical protein